MYLNRQSKGEGAPVYKTRAHEAFYMACHIPFYVVGARHDDFRDNKKRTKLKLLFKICFLKAHFYVSSFVVAIIGFPANCQL